MTSIEIKEDAKKIMSTIINKFQVYGFWCLILISIGFYSGIKYNNYIRSNSIAESIKLGNFIYDGNVFEVKNIDCVK